METPEEESERKAIFAKMRAGEATEVERKRFHVLHDNFNRSRKFVTTGPTLINIIHDRWDDAMGCWAGDSFCPGAANLDEDFLLVFATYASLAPVRSSGLESYFNSQLGKLAPEFCRGMELIGFSGCARCLADACLLFGEPYPRNLEDRRSLPDASASLDRLSRTFYAEFKSAGRSREYLARCNRIIKSRLKP